MSSSFIYPNYIIGVCGERGPTGATGSTGPIGSIGNSGLNVFGTTGPGATGWIGYYGQGSGYQTISRSIQGVTVAVGNHIGLRFVNHFTDGTTAISTGSPFIGFTGFWFVEAGATCPGCTFSPVVSTVNFSQFKFSDNVDYNPLSTKKSTITLKTINTRTPETIGITLTDDLKNIRVKYTDYDGITLSGATAQSLVIGVGATTVAGATGSRWYGDENVVDWVTRQALEGITSISGITDGSDAFYHIDTKNNSIFQIKKSELNSIKIRIKPDNTISSDESKSLLLIVPLETAFTGGFEIDGEGPVQVYFPLNVIPKPEPGINVYAAISYGQDWYMNCVGLGITQDYWSKQNLKIDNLYLPSESLFTLLLTAWGNTSHDLNNDGTVNATDVTIALSQWSSNDFQPYYKNCVNITGISYGRECIGPVPPPPQPPPTLASVSPETGPEFGGTPITIIGTGFTGANSVKVGLNPATNLQVISPIMIKAKTPAGSGQQSITVTTPVGTATGLSFVYTGNPPALPTITNVEPSTGHRYGEDEILIYGTNLDTTTRVLIQDRDAVIIQKTYSSVKVRTPRGNPGPAKILLTNTGGTEVYNNWSYRPAVPPIITSINPITGPANGGYSIIITGQNFNQVESVRIGNNECNYNVPSSLSIIIPSIPSGQEVQPLMVQTYEGLAIGQFTYRGNPPPPPVINEVIPSQGSVEGGTVVQLRGQNLNYEGDLTVTIGGETATVQNRTDTLVVIITPASTEATQQVLKFSAENGTVLNQFTYTACIQPTTIDPINGPACSPNGRSFKISGSNLQGINEIIFNNNPNLSATNISVHTNGNFLTARTPVEFPIETWDQQLTVTVKKPGCTDAHLPNSYTPRRASYNISSAAWSNTFMCQGLPGNFGELNITGNNFADQGIHRISLQKIGGNPISTSSFNIDGSTLIKAQFYTPIQAGSWTVHVETPCDSKTYPLPEILVCEPICSPILNHQVPTTNNGSSINLVTGVVQNGPAIDLPGWDISVYGAATATNNVALGAANANSQIMRNPGAGTSTFRTNLEVGTVVGPTAFWYGNSAAVIGTSVGQWSPNSTGYFGLKFLKENIGSSSTTHYGYVAMHIGANATDRRIVGYCWNPIPNAAITVQEI